MHRLFRLKEDLPLDQDWFGVRKPAGVAKAGMLFELIREPTPEKKKYKLTTYGIKFPYDLYLRKNDFKRLFEEVDSFMTVSELVHKYMDHDYIVDGIELEAGTPVPENLKNRLVWMYSANEKALRLRAVTLPDKC